MTPDRDPSTEPPVTSIVHSPDTDALADSETDYIEASLTSIAPSPVEAFLTPWGIGSILIFLLANSLLSWSQALFATRPIAETPVPERIAALDLSTLPTLPRTTAPRPADPAVNVRVPAPAPVTAPVVPIPAKPVVKPVVNRAKPVGSLTTALIPPSLQPAVMPVHSLSARKIQRSIPAPPPVSTLPPPPPTGAIEIVGNPTPAPAPSPALMNERMLNELRQREEAPANLPFYQREKARRTAIQNQQDATELMKQLPPQLQVQPSPQPAAAPAPIPQSPPSVPAEIIIEGR